MPAVRPNPRLAKIHRTYTVEEIAKLFGIHRNTVRAWIKAGLPTIDERRPTLIQGSQVAAFLQARRARNKRTCQPGEIYCVRCREPRVPVSSRVIYQPLGPGQGNLVGVCSTCGAGLFRRVSAAKVALILGSLNVTGMEALEHIGESHKPSANSDFEQDDSYHGNAQR
jgi:excisionase family DNA binding protein